MADTHITIPMARLIELETAEHERDILRTDKAKLVREAHTWSKAAETYAADAERFRWLAEHTVATGLARWVHPFQFLGEAVDARRKLNRPPTPVGWSDTDWIAHLERDMQATHTPGPWHQDCDDETFIRARGDEPGVCAVARVCRRGGWSEQEGNRRLIQAAPDLLAAIQALLAADWNTESGYEASKAARAAVAKATGEQQAG